MKSILCLLVVLVLSTSAHAKTFVMPHVLERSGRVTAPQGQDTSIVFTYFGGLDGTGRARSATVELFLYGDANGQPLPSATARTVCNPCTFQLDGQKRKRTVSLDDLITQAGGFPTSNVSGYAIIVVGGEDPDAVAMQGFIVNSHTSALDVSVFGFEPQPLKAATE